MPKLWPAIKFNTVQKAFSHCNNLAPVVRRLDNAIHFIKLYPVDNAKRFAISYTSDSDLSVG